MSINSSTHLELSLMFTDIVGYSRLMGRDEALTIDMLGEYRTIVLAHIAEHGGVFIEFAGDAIFSRFDSALSAVSAAIAIQQHLYVFNQARDKCLPRLRTRIGIHKGAVLLRNNAVLGDDVNIAARLEPLAIADSICISEAVYNDIKTNVHAPIKFLGLQSLKNIQQKIRVYLIKPSGFSWRVHTHYFWLGCAKKISAYRYPMAIMLLAIFVAGFYFIPRWLVPGYAANYVEITNFKNVMSSNSQADYFSSGITEAVRSQLADMRDVYIVDADKGIHAPIRLEGSVQKNGDNLRIVYRIVKRKGNVQIAGGKLDGAYQDIFILQDRLVSEIAKCLATEFKLKNFRPAPIKLTNDITAYDYYLKAMDYLSKPSSQENFDAAIQHFNEALVHDHQFILANAGLCEVYRLKYELTSSASWIKKAESYCLTVLQQDDNSANANAAIGALYRDTGKYPEAIQHLQQALEKNPENVTTAIALARTYDLTGDDSAAEATYLSAIKQEPKNWEVYQGYGYFLIRKGRHQEAILHYKKVLTLTPDNVVTLNNIGAAYLYLGDFNKAAESLELAAAIEPNDSAFSNLGVMYYYSGDFEKAVKWYQQSIKLEPTNIHYLNNIVDAYVFINGSNKLADEYSKKVYLYAEKEIVNNPFAIAGYLYLALAHVHFGRVAEAKEMVKKATKLDANDAFSFYVNLRIAVVENNQTDIIFNAQHLQKNGYSEKLILTDPYFSVLREHRFHDIFKK